MSEPAFPHYLPNETVEYYHGLTKLEYFSGQAMQGFSANTNCWEEKDLAETAKLSIDQAKELIKQLAKEK